MMTNRKYTQMFVLLTKETVLLKAADISISNSHREAVGCNRSFHTGEGGKVLVCAAGNCYPRVVHAIDWIDCRLATPVCCPCL